MSVTVSSLPGSVRRLCVCIVHLVASAAICAGRNSNLPAAKLKLNTAVKGSIIVTFSSLFERQLFDHCRAILCVSADYAVARCLSVLPSVCLSHTDTVSKWLNIFSPSGSHSILVFLYQTI